MPLLTVKYTDTVIYNDSDIQPRVINTQQKRQQQTRVENKENKGCPVPKMESTQWTCI
jgi:hypothetical protein